MAEHNEINWGGVVKGAAIVAGVAVAAVVGFWALGALSATVTGAVTASPALSALAAGAHTGLVGIAHGAGWLLGATGQLLSEIPAGLASIFGLTGQHFAQAAAVNHVAGVVGAAGAGAVAAHAAMPYLDHTHLTQPATAPADAGVLASQSLAVAPAIHLHDLSHIAHHAAEHGSEHAAPLWTQRFTPRPASASYAENAQAAKEERRNTPQPAASFTEQLNADRAELDTALAK